MPNRLAGESSPYLLQHQNNPVDWRPWGPEALETAKREDRPIFLSIGYSACHWCHVMEHESFENEQIAQALNETFVCIKVDREERPDLDQIYMNAVQMMTGRGGWPMSVFLTPDLKPFYGGTYWPPRGGRGMPGFDEIIRAVGEAWKHRRDQAETGANQLAEQIVRVGRLSVQGELSPELLHRAESMLERDFDHEHGGLGHAPKFPRPMDISLLLRIWRRNRREEVLRMIRLTLDKMAAGGIYDHLGGGFARYSVDQRWLVPHFEKMLYDNALLAGVYIEAFQATGQEDYARVARETIEYVLRDMSDPAGGFYSTEDADSEGEEGKFYTWTRGEMNDVLGADEAELFARVYDVSEEGNFEGKNILNLPKTIEQCAKITGHDVDDLRRSLAASRERLLAVRNRRVRPARDDKVLVSWNGLFIDALARAAGALAEPRYLAAATRAADFILERMHRDDGRLLHTWRSGVARLDAYLDDYACLIQGLVSIYEAGYTSRYLQEAARLADLVLAHFGDAENRGFFFTPDDHEPLIARPKDYTDSSTPGGAAMAATALLRLGKLTGRRTYLDAAEQTLQDAAGVMARAPTATGQMLIAADMYLGPTYEIVWAGSAGDAALEKTLAKFRKVYLPNCVSTRLTNQADPARDELLGELLAGKTASREPTLYICQEFACQAPAQGQAAIDAAVAQLAVASA